MINMQMMHCRVSLVKTHILAEVPFACQNLSSVRINTIQQTTAAKSIAILYDETKMGPT